MATTVTPVQFSIVDLSKSMWNAGEVDIQIEVTKNGESTWINVLQVVMNDVVISTKIDGVDAPEANLEEYGVKMVFISDEEYDIIESHKDVFCGMAFFTPHFA